MNCLFPKTISWKSSHPIQSHAERRYTRAKKKQNNKTWRVGERERWWASIARRLISWIFLLLNFDASQRGKFSNYISFSFTFSSTFWVPNWEVDFAFCDFFSDDFFSSHSLLDERATDGGEKEARTSGMRLWMCAAKGFARISLRTQNNYVAWCRYLHSEYKPIIAIKFAIKYRIKIGRISFHSAHTMHRAREVFIVEKSSLLFSTKNEVARRKMGKYEIFLLA